uniref:Uncharacterized protein n=1 Tax=Hyaloperonospora arabidopsidis (strain Emoy2) TaxID=559515 RepID=M4BF15_HYAAE
MWSFALHVRIATNLRSSAAALVTLSSFVMLLSVLGFVGAKRDRKSRLLLLFFFCNFLLVSSLFVMCYAAFFFQDALESWIKHHWAASALRDKPCCTTYSDTVQYLKRCAVIVGGLGIACMLLVISAMYCVVRIVTVPVVMRRMQSVLNVVFMILGTGLFVVGLLCDAHDEMTSGQKWMAIILITVGALLFALSVLGIITSRARSRSLLLTVRFEINGHMVRIHRTDCSLSQYIIGLGGCLVALVVCSFSAFSFSDKLAWTFQEQKTSSKLACDLSLPGCTNCTELVFEMTRCKGAMCTFDNYWVACDSSMSGIEESATGGDCLRDMTIINDNPDQGYIGNDIAKCGKCPEWSATDVRVYLQSLLHLLGLFALVVCLFIALGFAATNDFFLMQAIQN